MRTFGVEIECYVPARIGQEGVARALRALGLDAVPAPYGGREYWRWQIKTDGSLTRPPAGYTGIEVVSPILTWGDAHDEDMLRQVSEYLVSIDARVNGTCGGHVHIGVSDLGAMGLANLVESYYRNYCTIDAMIPASRDRRWCRHPGVDHVDWVAADLRTSHRRRRVGDIGGHNNAINGDHYAERGTLEFRHRDGTVNHYKIMGWVGFLMGMIENARTESMPQMTTVEEIAAHLVANECMTDVLREWFMRRVPRITVEIAPALAEARERATVRVSRLMRLQGVTL